MNSRASEYALRIADRLIPVTAITTALPSSSQASLAHGLAGTALLHARLAAIDPSFENAAAAHWKAAADLNRQRPTLGSGIYGDRGGLSTSLIIGTTLLPIPDPHHYAAHRAASGLATQATHLASQPIRGWAGYDVINGLAGIGRVLLSAHTCGHSNIEFALRDVLHKLTHFLAPTDNPRPRWWLPADQHPASVRIDSSGAATTGLAHGVAGPLAFLALAHHNGYTVPGQADAIHHAAHWLLRWRTPGSHSWPPHITGRQLDHPEAVPTPGRTDAWCYGTPGIALALAHAGVAINDLELTSTATTAMASLSRRSATSWDTDDPTFCHGTAGVLQTASVLHPSTASTTAAQILGTINRNPKLEPLNPGLLTGAAGIALALADHARLPAIPSLGMGQHHPHNLILANQYRTWRVT